MSADLELTVGPVLFNWAPEKWSDFYARIADEAPVDKVVVGEVVCSKRSPFFEDLVMPAVERLQRGGKDVVLATLGLLTTVRERKAAAELCALEAAPVEINDLTTLSWVKAPFEVGPLVNVYNESTVNFLARKGARAICLPPELPFASVATIAAAGAKAGVGVEVWAYGRAPLAISARCYHARVHALSKDSCQFVCNQDDDGLEVDTLEGQSFLAINGVQTMSHNYCNLVGDIEQLASAGVTSLRLSPHAGDFVAIAQAFRARLDGAIDAAEAMARISAAAPNAKFSNGFLLGASGADTFAPASA